ncbi:hypothetical protein [Cerasicoccus frondis]|uniref:hypothetical protein n=1 Tax=Cerasicoccus frondis TaxID=490090 RepID=UPI0028526181|nr:hypothetical protein [Cerasicoccus frondis]
MVKNIQDYEGGVRGFALVVALSLMSFMLLIALSMATLTRTELATSAYVASEAMAKENARLGLLVALGHLQSAAGSDQRVTARANILSGAGMPHEYWTGVWDATDGSLMTWLVSGNANSEAPTQFSPLTQLDNGVTLWGGEGSNFEVMAPLQDVDAQGFGRYAYWIMDEGVKARINLNDPAWESTDEAQLRRARESTWRYGIEEIEAWESMREFRGKVQWGESLEKVISQGQVDILQSNIAGGGSTEQLAALALAGSVVSRSLPVSVSSGGFRKDLSRILDVDYNDAPYATDAEILPAPDISTVTWGVLRSFANPWANWSDAMATMPVIAPTAPESNQAGLFPLPVMLQIGWGAMRSGSEDGATLRLTMKPVVALANPYDVALAPSDYQLEVQPATGRGYVMVSFDPEPEYSSSEFEDGVHTRPVEFFPKDLLGEYPTLQLRGVAFEPGEVKLFGLADTDEYPEAGEGGVLLAEAYPTANYAWKDTRRILGSHTRGPEGRVTMQISGGRYSLLFRLSEDGVWKELQTIEDIGIGISPSSNQLDDGGQPKVQVSLEPEEGGLPPSINLIRRRFNMRNSATDYVSDNYAGTGLRWLADFNPRSSFENTRPPDWISHPLWLADAGNTNNQLPLNADWISDFQLDSEGDARGFWGASSDAAGESVVTLFSVPRQPITSLGYLQHAPLSSRVWDPSYAVGNSYASPFVEPESVDLSYELNAFFWDDFFFSGLSGEDNSGEWIAKNPRIELLREPTDLLYSDPELAAAGLMIRGGFNVNSTSLDAWKAFLSNFGGLSMAYYDTDASAIEEVVLDNSFFRTPNPNGSADKEWSGYHALNSEQVENLAAQIVYRIRARGEPFNSLAEFINRPLEENVGLLQAAIDATAGVELNGESFAESGINSSFALPQVTSYDSSAAPNPEAGLGSRNTAAPGWLTQADVLTAIGPYLTVRSDTFIIRSYGDFINPYTHEIEAEAICEAVVQRFPEAVTPVSQNPDEPAFFEPMDEMGREFKVIDFRWLKEGEI